MRKNEMDEFDKINKERDEKDYADIVKALSCYDFNKFTKGDALSKPDFLELS